MAGRILAVGIFMAPALSLFRYLIEGLAAVRPCRQSALQQDKKPENVRLWHGYVHYNTSLYYGWDKQHY
jgi:hypothetical protein